MTDPLTQYDTRQPLECCEFKSLNRCIGVTISRRFKHTGTGKQMVDIERETPSINTHTYGRICNAEDARSEAAASTWKTIADLDKIIDELEAHRERLQAELQKLAPSETEASA